MIEPLAQWTQRIHTLIFYRRDGKTLVYDIDDPKIPLPSFLALVPIK